MEQHIYSVVHFGGAWEVLLSGRVLSSYNAKEPAVSDARQRAVRDRPSRLVVHRGDGTTEYERIYAAEAEPAAG